MSRMPKGAKKAYDKAKEFLPNLDDLPMLPAIKKPYGPPSTDEERDAFFHELMILKMHRQTNKQCGDQLGVSERTIANYLADPLYREQKIAFEADSKEGARLMVSDMAFTAMKTMEDLMNPAVTTSEYVRYSAARTVGEWLGLNIPREEARNDAQQEVAAFLKQLEEEKLQIVTNNNIQINITGQNDRQREDMFNSIVESLPGTTPALPSPTSPQALEEEKMVAPTVSAFPGVLPGGKLPDGW